MCVLAQAGFAVSSLLLRKSVELGGTSPWRVPYREQHAGPGPHPGWWHPVRTTPQTGSCHTDEDAGALGSLLSLMTLVSLG